MTAAALAGFTRPGSTTYSGKNPYSAGARDKRLKSVVDLRLGPQPFLGVARQP
jgi:hypothetical protein